MIDLLGKYSISGQNCAPLFTGQSTGGWLWSHNKPIFIQQYVTWSDIYMHCSSINQIPCSVSAETLAADTGVPWNTNNISISYRLMNPCLIKKNTVAIGGTPLLHTPTSAGAPSLEHAATYEGEESKVERPTGTKIIGGNGEEINYPKLVVVNSSQLHTSRADTSSSASSSVRTKTRRSSHTWNIILLNSAK